MCFPTNYWTYWIRCSSNLFSFIRTSFRDTGMAPNDSVSTLLNLDLPIAPWKVNVHAHCIQFLILYLITICCPFYCLFISNISIYLFLNNSWGINTFYMGSSNGGEMVDVEQSNIWCASNPKKSTVGHRWICTVIVEPNG